MKVHYEYDGKTKWATLYETNGEQGIRNRRRLKFTIYDWETSIEQQNNENLLKINDLALSKFKKIIEENNITLQIIKNSSVSKSKSIPNFLIENNMLEHLEYLVDKFGPELLNCGSAKMNEENTIQIGYESIWEASLRNYYKNKSFNVFDELMSLDADINLFSFGKFPNFSGYTILDSLIKKIESLDNSNCSIDEIIKIARYLIINFEAKCASESVNERLEIYNFLLYGIKIKNALKIL